MTDTQTTPEQELLLTVEQALAVIPEADDEDETLSVESAEELDADALEDEMYERWLMEQGCEFCSGCQYCAESSPFEGGTDT